MGDWRHFGERLEWPTPAPASASDCRFAAEPQADSVFARQPDGDGMRRRLAGVVEAEILPRLMLAHRDRPRPVEAGAGRHPTPDEIERLCALLLARAEGDVATHLLRFLDEGLTLEGVLVELLTPAARHVGALWEEDECDFIEVTLALGRLQAAARDLCTRFGDDGGPRERSILLLPCPGETHVFCLSILAGIFREAGWDVTTAALDSGIDPLSLARADWFDVIGLTLSCDVLAPVIADSISGLRTASCNPATRILVGGPYFTRNPDHVRIVGADATAEDGRLAPLIAESLLEKRTRAC
ncbi:cobalamin B12-binding domain-containing protein [Methylobacterium sp. Leaf118]|uniref:cobalamin B12-binding domain-containing protein n=1 Tax=Methylobacterium sp. Leaf118 TaxID=2876562 RepID=UPI001E52BCA3|nr:cobalamin B12-binding domain-containing protein [Methylobacterium sp. Leaf118]